MTLSPKLENSNKQISRKRLKGNFQTTKANIPDTLKC